MPTNPKIAVAMEGDEVCLDANAARYTAKLKFGPGNAWITANPNRKSRLVTHPSVTIYSRKRGITTGPPPNIMVPARKRLEKSLKSTGGCESVPLSIISVIKIMKKTMTTMVPDLTGIACS